MKLNPPKKWTEALWREGTQMCLTMGRRDSHASQQDSRASELAAERHPNASLRKACGLGIWLLKAGMNAAPLGASGFSGCSTPTLWHLICSKSFLLPIDVRAGLNPSGPEWAEFYPYTNAGGNDRAAVPWPHDSWPAKRCEVLRELMGEACPRKINQL